jgi:dodecin
VADGVYRVAENAGSSSEGVAQAIELIAKGAARTLRNLDWFEVIGIRGQFKNEAIAPYQVTVKIGFGLEDAGR